MPASSVVREAWPSPATGTDIVAGVVETEPVIVTSEMDDGGTIFADGIETDRLAFGWGRRVAITVAARKLALAVPGGLGFAHIQITIIGGPMKTTLDISGPLLREARKIAFRERTTLRALVEQGLRHVVAEKKRKRPFRLRDASFGGRGLRPELADASWEQLRDLAYEGRGS